MVSVGFRSPTGLSIVFLTYEAVARVGSRLKTSSESLRAVSKSPVMYYYNNIFAFKWNCESLTF